MRQIKGCGLGSGSPCEARAAADVDSELVVDGDVAHAATPFHNASNPASTLSNENKRTTIVLAGRDFKVLHVREKQ